MRLFLTVAGAALLVDQASKILIRTVLPLGEVYKCPWGFLRISHIGNTGAAFGLMQGSGWFLLAATVAAAVSLAYVAVKDRRLSLPLGLVFGGALGNAADRLVFGHVTDFLDLVIWPVFNLADCFIAAGVIIFLFAAWRNGRARGMSGSEADNS